MARLKDICAQPEEPTYHPEHLGVEPARLEALLIIPKNATEECDVRIGYVLEGDLGKPKSSISLIYKKVAKPT